jgi:hypothetical protein
MQNAALKIPAGTVQTRRFKAAQRAAIVNPS